MTSQDCAAALAYLSHVWSWAYGKAPDQESSADIELCRRYFDPLMRGQTLRERLSALTPTASPISKTSFPIKEPLVFALDEQCNLPGIEARLAIDLLGSLTPTDGWISIPTDRAAHAIERALDVYRAWSNQRLRQVSDLQRGTGSETMQAKAVGLVLALLVNRSTSAERAVLVDGGQNEARGAEKALFDGAEAFAAAISERNERSHGENRLKGGYAVTEARRRLVDFRIERGSPARYYLESGSERHVIDFLAIELAKRDRIDTSKVARAFDALVDAYREESRASTHLGGFNERAAETAQLRERLLKAMRDRRQQKRAAI